ncbi:hypothetical protein H9P43_002951 [Blastocladiella emersonii ATCC 22665]|nr:hypothetical protein H9P43_002951 [Blastocladiella emersonii ATCC 22665]
MVDILELWWQSAYLDPRTNYILCAPHANRMDSGISKDLPLPFKVLPQLPIKSDIPARNIVSRPTTPTELAADASLAQSSTSSVPPTILRKSNNSKSTELLDVNATLPPAITIPTYGLVSRPATQTSGLDINVSVIISKNFTDPCFETRAAALSGLLSFLALINNGTKISPTTAFCVFVPALHHPLSHPLAPAHEAALAPPARAIKKTKKSATLLAKKSPAGIGSRTSAAVRRARVAVRQVAQSAKDTVRKTLGSIKGAARRGAKLAKPAVSQDGRAATVANVAAALELQHSQDVVGGARQQVDQHHGVAQQQIDDGQVLDEQAPHHGVGTEEDLAQSQVNGGDAVPEPDHHADGSEQQEVDGGHAHGHADGQAGSEDPLSMPEMLDFAAEKGDEFACPDRVGGVGVRDAEVDEVEANNVFGLGRALAAKLPREYCETLVRIKRDLPNVLIDFVGQYFGYSAAPGESVLSHEAVERLAAFVRVHRKAPGEIALMGLMFNTAVSVSDKREVRILYRKQYAKDIANGTASFATALRVTFPDLFDTPERVADVVPYLQCLARVIDDALVVAAVTRREDPDVPSRQLAAAALLHLTANQFVVADEQRSDALMGMYYLMKFIGRESQL